MQRGPRCFSPFIAVKRTFAGGAFTPAFDTVGVNQASQQNASLSCATEACFKKVNERQADFAQFNRLDNQSKKVFLRRGIMPVSGVACQPPIEPISCAHLANNFVGAGPLACVSPGASFSLQPEIYSLLNLHISQRS